MHSRTGVKPQKNFVQPDSESYRQALAALASRERRSLKVWRWWMEDYYVISFDDIPLKGSPEFDAVYEKYRGEDSKYVNTRRFIGVLPDWSSLILFLKRYQGLYRYLGPEAANRLFFLLYPSCLLEGNYLSLLAPHKEENSERYIAHAAIPIVELPGGERRSYSELVHRLVAETVFAPGNFVYYDNQRADLFPEERPCAE